MLLICLFRLRPCCPEWEAGIPGIPLTCRCVAARPLARKWRLRVVSLDSVLPSHSGAERSPLGSTPLPRNGSFSLAPPHWSLLDVSHGNAARKGDYLEPLWESMHHHNLMSPLRRSRCVRRYRCIAQPQTCHFLCMVPWVMWFGHVAIEKDVVANSSPPLRAKPPSRATTR
jgi:hypothetical protein